MTESGKRENRAEEIIVETYRQVDKLRKKKVFPKRIIMPKKYWQKISDYHRTLGRLDSPLPDYLEENSLFGIEIWYGNSDDIQVE